MGHAWGHFLLRIFRGLRRISILCPFLAVGSRCSHFPPVPSTLFRPRFVETGSLLVGHPDSHPGSATSHALGSLRRLGLPGVSPPPSAPLACQLSPRCRFQTMRRASALTGAVPDAALWAQAARFLLSLHRSLPASRRALHPTSASSHWRVSLPVTHIGHHRLLTPWVSSDSQWLPLLDSTPLAPLKARGVPPVVQLLCAHRSGLCNQGCS